MVEVGGQRHESGFGEPVGLIAEVAAHSIDIVKDNDAGEQIGGVWRSEPGGYPAV
jgi:hypothetical protein